ncbi:MAG TPA: hypothetical protein VGL57_07735 [Solirubrobacteraceae bacterium]|jgi:hypothetical protein
MSDASIPYSGERLDQLELMVLHMMTGDELPIWAVPDLARELQDPEGVSDAIRGLRTTGLVHETSDGHVFPTRAAVRMVEITGKVA